MTAQNLLTKHVASNRPHMQAAVIGNCLCIREVQIEGAHPVGATGVSWAPATPPGSIVSVKGPTQPDKRFASSGCDNTVKVNLQLLYEQMEWTLLFLTRD